MRWRQRCEESCAGCWLGRGCRPAQHRRPGSSSAAGRSWRETHRQTHRFLCSRRAGQRVPGPRCSSCVCRSQPMQRWRMLAAGSSHSWGRARGMGRRRVNSLHPRSHPHPRHWAACSSSADSSRAAGWGAAVTRPTSRGNRRVAASAPAACRCMSSPAHTARPAARAAAGSSDRGSGHSCGWCWREPWLKEKRRRRITQQWPRRQLGRPLPLAVLPTVPRGRCQWGTGG